MYVVVPMYNEAAVIGAVVANLRVVFKNVVCVDDGSTDGSPELAAASGATVVRHPDNLGQGAAIQTGFSYALTDPAMRHTITFDADGQHRIEDAVAMLTVARDTGIDVVLGSRFLHQGSQRMPLSRKALLRAAVGFTRATTGLKLTDAHNGLRVLNRRATAQIQISLSGMAHASEILNQIAMGELSYFEQPITVDYTDYSRAKGQRNINAVNIAFDLLTARIRLSR